MTHSSSNRRLWLTPQGGTGSPTWVRTALRGFTALLLLVVLTPILGPAAPAAAASTTVSISPGTKSVQPGDNFDLEVTINTEAPTRGAQFGLTYDPTLFQVNKVTLGGFYRDWAKSHQATASIAIPFKPDNKQGKSSEGAIVVLGGAEKDGPTGSGPLATVSFTAKSGANGSSKIGLVNLIVSSTNAENIPNVAIIGGTVGIGVAEADLPQPTVDAPAPTPARATPVGTLTPGQGAAAPTSAPAPTQSPAVPKPVPAAGSPLVAATQPAALDQGGPPRATVQPATQPPAPAVSATAQAPAAPAEVASATVAPRSVVSTPIPAVPPRGSPGLIIPWEVIAAVGGGIVVTGLVFLAVRES